MSSKDSQLKPSSHRKEKYKSEKSNSLMIENLGKKQKRRYSSSSDDSSNSVSSSSTNSSNSSSDSISEEEKHRRRQKLAKQLKKKSIKEKKKKKMIKKTKKHKAAKRTVLELNNSKYKEKPSKKNKKADDSVDRLLNDISSQVMEKVKAMTPMTKEQWEKQQSVVRKVYDEETGRHRLIKGDGEILEEIVSHDRHKEINRRATQGDGQFFQFRLNLMKQ